MKSKHLKDNKGFGRRAILSSLAGELVDSGIFLPLAFIGTMPVNTLFIMMVTQVLLKVAYEIIILPITLWIVKKTQKYENEFGLRLANK